MQRLKGSETAEHHGRKAALQLQDLDKEQTSEPTMETEATRGRKVPQGKESMSCMTAL